MGGNEPTRTELPAGDAVEPRGRHVPGEPDAILVHDGRGHIVEVNQGACETLGYARDELIGMSVTDVEIRWSEADLAQIWERTRSERAATIDGLYRRRDGSTVPVEVHVSPFAIGATVLFLAAARHGTSRTRTEHDVLLFKRAIDAAPDAAYW